MKESFLGSMKGLKEGPSWVHLGEGKYFGDKLIILGKILEKIKSIPWS